MTTTSTGPRSAAGRPGPAAGTHPNPLRRSGGGGRRRGGRPRATIAGRASRTPRRSRSSRRASAARGADALLHSRAVLPPRPHRPLRREDRGRRRRARGGRRSPTRTRRSTAAASPRLRAAGVEVARRRRWPARALRAAERAVRAVHPRRACRSSPSRRPCRSTARSRRPAATPAGSPRRESRRAGARACAPRADAVMVGAGTARRDDPLLTVRDADGRDPVRVVVSRGGDLPAASAARRHGARDARTILLTCADRRRRGAQALTERGVEVVRAGEPARRRSRALAGAACVEILCEGGPTLAGGAARRRPDRPPRWCSSRRCVVGRGAPDLVALPAPAPSPRASP